MSKTFRFVGMVSLALFLAIFINFWGSGSPVHAQTGGFPSGPTTQNCFSDRYPAATDCDRLASGFSVVQEAALVSVGIPITGANPFGPVRCKNSIWKLPKRKNTFKPELAGIPIPASSAPNKYRRKNRWPILRSAERVPTL